MQRLAFGLKKTKDPWRKKPSRTVFIQCMRLWETSEEVLFELSFGLAGIAAQPCGWTVSGCGRTRLFHKEPEVKKQRHIKIKHFGPWNEPLVSAWIPFEDVTIQNGAMAYVPSSHKAGR